MMRKHVLFSGIFCLAVGLLASVIWVLRPSGDAVPRAPSKPSEPDFHFDPLVESLLRERATSDRERQPPFFKALTALAERHGSHQEEYIPEPGISEGRAAAIKAQDTTYVAVVLRNIQPVIPGSDTQHLLLLTADGRPLDRVSCEINNRLTSFYEPEGKFFTEVPEQPQCDEARLVIRYVPPQGEGISGNWSHDVIHGGATRTFHWDQSRPGAIPSAEWEEKGLCRVAVRGGKFAVVFPEP
jgi:hypothetical protein